MISFKNQSIFQFLQIMKNLFKSSLLEVRDLIFIVANELDEVGSLKTYSTLETKSGPLYILINSIITTSIVSSIAKQPELSNLENCFQKNLIFKKSGYSFESSQALAT